MKPSTLWICAALTIMAASGCRNCNTCWKPNPLAGLGSPTITPPSTGNYQFGQKTAPYYGTTIPPMQSSGGVTVPVQPASSVSPGWRPSGSQVPAQPANFNQTSYQAPSGHLLIPMNNVVSSTQTSTLRPNGELTQIAVANNIPQLAEQTVSTGMPINDSTLTANGTQAGSRQITGTYQYSTRPTRLSPVMPINPSGYGTPYVNNGVYNQGPATAQNYNLQPNPGWQDRNTPTYNR